MLTQGDLQEIADRIRNGLQPDKIILFGSHAWGEPTDDSDVDLLVIVPESHEPAHRRAARAHRALRGISAPSDIIVRTRDEMSRINPVRSSLLYRALTEGRALHG